MFRDPPYFRVAARDGRAAAADLSVAQDLGRRLQHRRGGVLAGHPAARGGAARAHADLRDRHQPAARCRRPRPASTTSIASPASPRTTGESGATLVAVRLLHRGLRPRRLRQVPEAAHRLLRPQPGDRQRLRRGAARLLPQRAHLLQPRAAGSRDRPVPRRAVPQGLSRARREGVAALLGARATPSPTLVARGSHLPEARTTR